MKTIRAFLCDESGATAIEYGLIAAILAVAAIAAFVSFGGALSGLFNFVSSRSSAAMGS